MPRNLGKDITGDSVYDAMLEGNYRFSIGVKIAFPNGTIRLTNDARSWNYNGNFDAVGSLLQVSSYSESSDLGTQNLNITLSGLDSNIVTNARDNDIQGSEVIAYISFIKGDSLNTRATFEYFRGTIDNMIYTQDAESITVQLKCENFLVRFDDRNIRRYTLEDQKQYFSTNLDAGLNFVDNIAEQQLVWGE